MEKPKISCNLLDHDVESCVKNLQSQFEIIDFVYCDRIASTIDLYIRIKKLYQESFENNQRIIFVITKDFSSSFSQGQTLENLQAMINDIDISNFFVCLVTTNPNISQEYQYVFDTISQDPIPFHVYQCQGRYEQINQGNTEKFSKYSSIKNITEQISALREDQRKLLFENKTFCMLAWTGINIEPNNRVRPCCEFRDSVGDSSKQSLATIWNSDSWKKIRKDMLNGNAISACEACYEKEKIGRDTLRQSANRMLIEKILAVDHTNDDGYLDSFQLAYWDIRYNNLCNLACRICNPSASSSWYQPALNIGKPPKHISPILVAGRNNDDIFDQIVHHIEHVKQIYFAGGEPSMIDKFYEILELLDAKNRNNDVRLAYNINMSRLTLKNKSLLELWKKFPHVSIGASLDGENQRGEYLRQGLSWQDVITNRKLILEQCPHVDFYVSSTVSILNVLHLPDFHKSWVEKGLIKPEEFNIQILFSPAYLSADRAPRSMKEKIEQIYHEHLEWLVPKDPLGRATYGFQSVLSYIKNAHDFNSIDFWNNIKLLDRYHKTDLIDLFPELEILPR